LAWLEVRAVGGTLVMRIEDVDRGRCRREYEAFLLDDLRWLGLDWDEGPDVGGAFGPYRQSERDDYFLAALRALDTYECTCTRRELHETSQADGQEPRYSGRCRAGNLDPNRPRSVRWRAPNVEIRVCDSICGDVVQNLAQDAGDFILRRSDGAFAYQLAVVVDDAAMKITSVVRGQDLLASTPRQIGLQRALGVATPEYAHVPLIFGSDGQKLSKRHGAPDLGQLRAGGADPRHVIADLARSLGLIDTAVDSVEPRELVGFYSRDLLRAAPIGGQAEAERSRRT
jgi:glutamyl-tRNA synthetase